VIGWAQTRTLTRRKVFRPICCNFLYAHVSPATNLAEIRRKLAEADEIAVRQGSALEQVPVSVFVRNGLEIEEQQ
jgi:hypothetical protein